MPCQFANSVSKWLNQCRAKMQEKCEESMLFQSFAAISAISNWNQFPLDMFFSHLLRDFSNPCYVLNYVFACIESLR